MGSLLDKLYWTAEADETGILSLRPVFANPGPATDGNPYGIRDWLDCYLHGEKPDFTPPLHLIGTPFQLRVWEMLRQIPYGSTTTYGALADALAVPRKRMSAQAVGQAVGRNPVALLVPCHRVVGTQGRLTGYAYGIALKQALLELEGGG